MNSLNNGDKFESEIDTLLKYFEEHSNEPFPSFKLEKKDEEEKAAEKVMKDNIQNQLKDVEKYIVDRCILDEIAIKTINNGFIVSKTYKFTDDFNTVYDKNHTPINIGDIVNLQVYYGNTTGTVVKINIVDSIVYVDVHGDVFYKNANECEIIKGEG